MEKLVQKISTDLTSHQVCADATTVEITEDKLKHWSNLTRVQKTFVNKMSGKQYKKNVWVRREDPKKQRQRVAQEPNAGRQRARRNEHTDHRRQNNQDPNRQQRGGVGELKERRVRRQPGWHHGSDIRRRIAGDKEYAFEQMLYLHEFQRDDEKMVKMTKYKNMVGFNKQDAVFFGNLMEKMKNAGGLRRLRESMDARAWQDVEFAVQGRMGKYSNQLADIHNDNNRWRNFKSLADAFKHAKGVRTDQLTGFTDAVKPMNKQVEDAFAQSGAKMMSSKDFQEAVGKRGPKWKEDGLVKRFDNAKYAAEVYYQMKEIGNNPNPHIQALYQKYLGAKFEDHMQHDRNTNVDALMKNGFGVLNMKQKNALKAHMKKMAPHIAEIFNAYKDMGIGVPAGKKFVGKGLKQIQDENMLKGPLREAPEKPAPAPLKERPQAPAKRPEQTQLPEKPAPAPLKERPGAGKNLFRDIEDAFSGGLAKELDFKRDFKVAARKGINTTYAVHLGSEKEGFYKPSEGNHDSKEYIREVMAYESAKFIGADSLVPPTKFYSPKVNDPGKEYGVKKHIYNEEKGKFDRDQWTSFSEGKGSIQMSTRVFGEKLGLTNVMAASEHSARNAREKLIDKCNNFQDLVVFDFLVGNTDRHQNNFHMAKTAGGGYQAVAIDHGFTFGGRESAREAVGRDHVKTAMKTSRKNAVVSFSEGIVNFDEGKYRELAKKNGLEDKRTDNFVKRAQELQSYAKVRGIKNIKLKDFANFLADHYRTFI